MLRPSTVAPFEWGHDVCAIREARAADITDNAGTASIRTGTIHKDWPAEDFVTGVARIESTLSNIPIVGYRRQKGQQAMLDTGTEAVPFVALGIENPAAGTIGSEINLIQETLQSDVGSGLPDSAFGTIRHDGSQSRGSFMVDANVIGIRALAAVPAVQNTALVVSADFSRGVERQGGGGANVCQPCSPFQFFTDNDRYQT